MITGQYIIEQDILDLLTRTQEEMDSYVTPLSLRVQTFISENYFEDDRLSKERSSIQREFQELALEYESNGIDVKICLDIALDDVGSFFQERSMQALYRVL